MRYAIIQGGGWHDGISKKIFNRFYHFSRECFALLITLTPPPVTSKKPDGYILGVVSTGVITVRPHLLKRAYDPLKDFTLISQYSIYIGAVTVLKDSPYKNIAEFI